MVGFSLHYRRGRFRGQAAVTAMFSSSYNSSCRNMVFNHPEGLCSPFPPSLTARSSSPIPARVLPVQPPPRHQKRGPAPQTRPGASPSGAGGLRDLHSPLSLLHESSRTDGPQPGRAACARTPGTVRGPASRSPAPRWAPFRSGEHLSGPRV